MNSQLCFAYLSSGVHKTTRHNTHCSELGIVKQPQCTESSCRWRLTIYDQLFEQPMARLELREWPRGYMMRWLCRAKHPWLPIPAFHSSCAGSQSLWTHLLIAVRATLVAGISGYDDWHLFHSGINCRPLIIWESKPEVISIPIQVGYNRRYKSRRFLFLYHLTLSSSTTRVKTGSCSWPRSMRPILRSQISRRVE